MPQFPTDSILNAIFSSVIDLESFGFCYENAQILFVYFTILLSVYAIKPHIFVDFVAEKIRNSQNLHSKYSKTAKNTA